MRSLVIVSVSLSFLLAAPVLRAQAQDAPPLDMAQVLAALKELRETQTKQLRSNKQRALSEVQGLAASGPAAANAWEEAVRQVQFQGSAREGAKFREWKQREGEGLNTRVGETAARLHFAWLALTLQRSLGVTNKDLLPQVIAFTKEVSAHQETVANLDEAIKKDRELSQKNPARGDRKEDAAKGKRMSDQILGAPVTGSVVAQAMKLGEYVNVAEWEPAPGNVDGIFQRVILPVLRAAKDTRVLEYWDMRIKRETEQVSKDPRSFEVDRFSQVRRPALLWQRAEELVKLGFVNRGATEMFGLIKNHPGHPQSAAWIERLEALIAPPAPGAPAVSPVPPPLSAEPPAPGAGAVPPVQ